MSRIHEQNSAGGGRVVALPLKGRCFLLTGEEETSAKLKRLLLEAGAETRSLPLTATAPPADPRPLIEAAARLSTFHWCVLTSARAARALRSVLSDEAAADLRNRETGQGPLWGCVGPATAAALLADIGVRADLVPVRPDALSLARGLLAWEGKRAGRIATLFLAAENARMDLVNALTEAGWPVTRVTAYRTMARPVPASALLSPRGGEGWDGVLFASGMAVDVFVEAAAVSMGRDEAAAWLKSIRPVVLGKTAEEALRRHGLASFARAERPSLEDLRDALVGAYSPAGASDSLADLGR